MIQTRITYWLEGVERKPPIEIKEEKTKEEEEKFWEGWKEGESFINDYKEIKIKKKRGGFRTIHIPPEPLKKIQIEILCFLRQLWVRNPDIKGLIPKSSYVDHAEFHSNSRFVFQVDIKDAFPSVKISLLHKILSEKFLSRGLVKDYWKANQVAALIIRLTTFKQTLPQGAPTSPFLFYIYLLELKLIEKLYQCCEGLKDVKISCYVDNIVVSSSHFISPKIREKVIETIEDCGFQINKKKVWFRDVRQGAPMIAGLRVNGNGRISLPKKEIKKWRAIIHNTGKSYDPSNPEVEKTIKKIEGFIASLSPVYEKIPPQILKPYELLLYRIAQSRIFSGPFL
jgi:hypothetical protein